MKSGQIIDALYSNYQHNYFRIDGQYVFNWESDFFMLTTSNYAIEIEVKVSRGDYNADFRKKHKHRLLASGKTIAVKIGHGFGRSQVSIKQAELWNKKGSDFINGKPQYSTIKFIKMQNNVPNRFYFCCPEGMVTRDEIPDYAGLLYAIKRYNGRLMIQEIKRAPIIHKEDFTNYRRIAQRLDMNGQRLKYDLRVAREKLDRYRKQLEPEI